jgi:hypothetical protein
MTLAKDVKKRLEEDVNNINTIDPYSQMSGINLILQGLVQLAYQFPVLKFQIRTALLAAIQRIS